MRWFPRSKSALFTSLMVLAAVTAILPSSWTNWMRKIAQPLSWGQAPLTAISNSAAATLEEWTEPVPDLSPEAVRALQQRLTDVELLAAQQGELLAQREATLAEISGLRQGFPDGEVRLILGRIVSFDSDPQRQTFQISPGERAGIRKGDWVAAGLRRGETLEDIGGRELLLKRWLVGRVIEVDPYLARVQRCTDPKFQAKVSAGRMRPTGGWEVVGESLVVSGAGAGKMRVADATMDHFEAGSRVILSVPGPDLPVRMALGRVVGSRRLVESALHYALEIEPWDELTTTSNVYVISGGPRGAGRR
jgi:cell shape-determining protein MreC